MRIQRGHVLIKITTANKRSVFEEEVSTDSGIITLFKNVQQDEDLSESYAQAVEWGEVIAVADDIKHIEPGDIAILDYLVDSLDDKVVYSDENGKIVCLDTRTIYHEDDRIVYASLKTRNDMFVWSKGDVDEASLIYGVFRGDKLIPNPPYIICEHKDFAITSQSADGLTYSQMEDGSVVRRILVPNEFSDPELLSGVFVVVEDFCLYTRKLGGKKFDVIMDQDIEFAIE